MKLREARSEARGSSEEKRERGLKWGQILEEARKTTRWKLGFAHCQGSESPVIPSPNKSISERKREQREARCPESLALIHTRPTLHNPGKALARFSPL